MSRLARLGILGAWWAVALVTGVGVSAARDPEHWAYRAVVRPAVPSVQQPGWTRTPVDRFILARLDAAGLAPSPRASNEELARRLSLALTGLPLALDELDAFLADDHPDAVERLVDRLLASPAYGERMALPWLDLARYADTHGYHADTHREMWRWRDWVIDALNRDLPFDQFSIEQLAGDLLPQPTIDQQIATGFQRNHMIIFENGVIAEEYRTEYVADRTNTFATVWLGQTFQCARCHDHKHDPFTQRDYFQLFAFFNNVPEQGIDGQYGNAVPFVPAPTRAQQEALEKLTGQSADLRRRVDARLAGPAPKQAAWEAAQRRQHPQLVRPPVDMTLQLTLDETEGTSVRNAAPRAPDALKTLKVQGEPTWLATGDGRALLLNGETWIDAGETGPLDRDAAATFSLLVFPTVRDALSLASRSADDNDRRGWELSLDDGHVRLRFTHSAGADELDVRTERPLPLRKWQRLLVVYDGRSRAAGVEIYVDGQREKLVVQRDALTQSVRIAGPLRLGRNASGEGFRGMWRDVRVWPRALTKEEIAVLAGRDPVAELLAVPIEARSAAQAQQIRRWYLEAEDAEFRALSGRLEANERELAGLRKSLPTTMVMRELAAPRATHVLQRGDYRTPGERVEPNVPGLWRQVNSARQATTSADTNGESRQATDAPRRLNRLDLARWLFDSANPLTARVAVNRFWQADFGVGLVRTSDDFGTHGDAPSHPELLDWLADEFRTGPAAWDMKRLHRLLTTSGVFLQSSAVDSRLAERDPENRLWARGPRARLSAELLRDTVLAASGLLTRRVGGPSVLPPQPAGLWEELAYDTQSFTAQRFQVSQGGEIYRRGVYVFVKRASPYPVFSTFDGPDRETCVAARTVSHTPLQALVLMNEPSFVEAARGLAKEARRATPKVDEQIEWMMRSLISRRPTAAENKLLAERYTTERAEFTAHPLQAAAVLGIVYDAKRHAPGSLEAQAALTIVASVLMQLDEVLIP